MCEYPSCRRLVSRAFTLIELLVVVAIIALLIAVLLPSLEAARRQAKQTACLSNIKGIATSGRVYATDDPQDWGIPAHPLYRKGPEAPTYIGAYEWGGKSGIGWDDWLGPSNPLNSRYGTKAGFGPATRPLNDILYKGGLNDNNKPFHRTGATQDTHLDLDLFRCPGDDGPPRAAHCPDWVAHSERSSYDHFGNSYAANLFMIGAAIVMNDGMASNYTLSNSPYLRPLSRVPNASRTLFYEENIGRWAWACRREVCPAPGVVPGVDPGPTKAVRGWHGKDWTYNRSFVDAHAERQKVYIEGTEDGEGYAEHYVMERLDSYPVTCVEGGEWWSYG